ncbi:MAG: hypothetical protein ACE5KA_06570 [Nitrososphaerales archaeon]
MLKGQRRVVLISTILISIAGLIATVTGIWFIIGDHPFNHEGGFSREFEMMRAELEAINPNLVSWPLHVSDQVGNLSMGWVCS